ncbi:unnamed protein product [Diamesa serratosioi]
MNNSDWMNASDVNFKHSGITNNDDDALNSCDPQNTDFNCSVTDFLLFSLGSQQMPLDHAILVTIFFVGIFVTGFIGNVIVCIVIVNHATMHTATNYYLFSLAVSDLLFLLMGLPYDLSLYWHQYPYSLGLAFCRIRAFVSEASTYVSVLTIVAFSMERFLAICHPLHLYTMSGLQRAVRIIAALWIISFLSAVPFGIFTKIHYIDYPPSSESLPDSAFCAMLDNPDQFPLWEVSFAVFFAIPMLIMLILYGRMGLKIRSRTRHTAALGVQMPVSNQGESRQSQSRRAIIRMLAAVVITFFVCWAPFHAQRLLYLYRDKIETKSFKILNQWVFAVSGWLYYVSCTINPILYNVMSHRYRIAFRETLCSRKRGYYSSANGFSRDQSSFRETTVAAAGRDHNLNYEGSQLVSQLHYDHAFKILTNFIFITKISKKIRTKSMLASNRSSRYKNNGRLNSSTRWKENNNIKRNDSVKSTDTNMSHVSTKESNVIVVCIGTSFKTKCLPPTNTTLITQTLPLTINNLSSSPTVPGLKTTFINSNNNKTMTNSKLNHNLVGSNGDFTRINCQNNNVLEEEDEEEDKGNVMFDNSKCDLMSSVLQDNGSSGVTTGHTLRNGVHSSNDEHSFDDENVSADIRNTQTENLLIFNKQSLQTNQQQPNKLIKSKNDFTTETCI